MNENDRKIIKNYKEKVISMLNERHVLTGSNSKIESPSTLWTTALSSYDYMLGLDEAEYGKLRMHTHHFTGDAPNDYWGDAQAFRAASGVDTTTKNIPLTHILNEPAGGIGFHYNDGRFLSKDIIRFQSVINTLYRHGIIKDLSGKQKSYLMEIGAGYGGFLHHLSSILGNSTCVIIDLPEILLFSASYLYLHNPGKKIYLYDKSNYIEFIKSPEAKSYDFILVPNYKFNLLGSWKFDLVINMDSMQEMRTEQVNEYLDFISRVCSGIFYSLNLDCYIDNKELTGLSELLEAKFDVTEILPAPAKTPPAAVSIGVRLKLLMFLSKVAKTLLLLKEVAPPIAPDMRYTVRREYLCRPKRR
jgi:putative sugar O-methyltransferase